MSALLRVLEPNFDRGPQSLLATPPPAFMHSAECPSHWAITCPSKNELVLGAWYLIPGTTMSLLGEGTILHWPAYTGV